MADETQSPRGIRNNNPGNSRWSSIQWDGLVRHRTDPDFCQFVDAYHGIRALALNLHSYYLNHSLNTVSKIIGRWAPPNENDTDAYIHCVAERMGVKPEEPISLNDWLTLHNLVEGIITQENGLGPHDGHWYDQGVLGSAISNVLGIKP